MARDLLVSSALLVLFVSALSLTQASDEENQEDVAVEDMVYCQSCDRFGSWSLSGSTPIEMAKVSFWLAETTRTG